MHPLRALRRALSTEAMTMEHSTSSNQRSSRVAQQNGQRSLDLTPTPGGARPAGVFLGRLTAAVAAARCHWSRAGRSCVPGSERPVRAPKKFQSAAPDSFQEGVTFLEEHRLFLFRESSNYHAISGICTHLGCTVKFSPLRCPGGDRAPTHLPGPR